VKSKLCWRHVLQRESGLVQVVLHGKGRKVRSVLLPRHFTDEFLTMQRGPDEAVFQKFNGQRRKVMAVSKRTMHDMVSQAAERVGLKGHIPAEALRLARRVSDEGVAPDIHCFVYTPRSFTDLLRELIGLDLLPFEVAAFEKTQPGEIEFFLTLRKSNAPAKDRAASVPMLDSSADDAAPAALQAIVADIPTRVLMSTLSTRVVRILASYTKRLFR